MANSSLRLFRRERLSQVLGPGRRAVLWVQGCPLACPGCVVPESWPTTAPGVEQVEVREVADWLLDCPDIEGLTLSGGEPGLQAAPLVELIDRVRSQRDLGVMCYTGYRLEQLRGPAQIELLGRVDLLVEGPYVQEEHADLLWRGSRNQRLTPLTPRYLGELPPHRPDRGAGLEFSIRSDGGFAFTGLPPWPDYRAELGV